MASNKNIWNARTLIILAVIVVLGGFVVARMKAGSSGSGGTADAKVTLAQCLTDKGVKFYGASWCPHCAQQKKAFGSAAMRDIDYVECAVPGDSRAQSILCQEANIRSYPTWRFTDGSELLGEQTLSDLAEKAGCTYDLAASTEASAEASAE